MSSLRKNLSVIIMGSSNASCQFEPMPTWLLKLCSSELIPLLTKVITVIYPLKMDKFQTAGKLAALIRPIS